MLILRSMHEQPRSMKMAAARYADFAEPVAAMLQAAAAAAARPHRANSPGGRRQARS